MDKDLARDMINLTSAFYAQVAPSFSATRQNGWPGWERLLQLDDLRGAHQLRLFDVACGNLRFERYLQNAGLGLETWAVDNCEELVALGVPDVHFAQRDISMALLEGDEEWASAVPRCDLCVSFGFMHHLPLFEQRSFLLRVLASRSLPGGYVAVTFWQFANDARLARKARPLEGGDDGDYLLGWQDTEVLRYCHHASEEEIDALVASVADCAHEVARFSADGRSGKLNRYVVLQT